MLAIKSSGQIRGFEAKVQKIWNILKIQIWDMFIDIFRRHIFSFFQYWSIKLGRKCLFIVRHMLLGPMEPNLNWFWNFANFELILKNFLHRNVVVRNWNDNCKVFGTNINGVHFYELQSNFMNCHQLLFSAKCLEPILWIAINFHSLRFDQKSSWLGWCI